MLTLFNASTSRISPYNLWTINYKALLLKSAKGEDFSLIGLHLSLMYLHVRALNHSAAITRQFHSANYLGRRHQINQPRPASSVVT